MLKCQPPEPVDVTLFGNRVFADYQIEDMRIGLTPYDWCPYEKGTFENSNRHPHTENTGEHEGRDWGSATLSQGTAAFASDHQTVGARHRTDSPSQPQEGPTL